MDLDEEDQEGKVDANKIFPSGISSGTALALAMAAAISTLADEDNEELKFEAVSWSADFAKGDKLFCSSQLYIL